MNHPVRTVLCIVAHVKPQERCVLAMRGYGRRSVEATALFLVLFVLAVPVAAFAVDAAVSPDAPVAAPAPNEAVAPDAADEAQAPANVTPDTTEPEAPPVVGDSASAEAADAAPSEAGEDQTDTSSGGSHVSGQANPDMQAAVESVLTARKHQFDATTAALQRSIDRLSAIIRRLDAANVNTSAARARLAEARTALARAKAAERLAVARYRGVLSAENEGSAYAGARAAARASSLQLERARVKLLTAAKTLRAIVKNVTV